MPFSSIIRDTGRRGIQILKRALRRFALLVLRRLFRIVNPVLVSDWAALSAEKPDPAKKIYGRRVWAFVTPTAPEVVANLFRGLFLFGSTGSRDAQFDWRWFPARAVITPETAKIPKRLLPLRRLFTTASGGAKAG
jgi:hypothetical protein